MDVFVPRIRSKQHTVTTPNVAFDFEDYGTGNIGDVYSTDYYSHLTDYKGKARVKPCEHHSWKVFGNPKLYRPFMTEGRNVTLDKYFFAPLAADHFDGILGLPEESSLANNNLDAFNSFSTVFPSEFSPVEFVKGIIDWRQLVPHLKGDRVKDIAGLYLTEEFGWTQLVKDVRYFLDLLGKAEARLTWLKRTRGKPTPLHYAVRITDPTVSSWRTMFRLGSWGLRTTLIDASLRYSASATLLHYIDHLDDDVGLFRAVSSALGLNSPLKAFWQALPMTFLIDWVWNVSGLLDRLAQIKPSEQWDVYDVSHSIALKANFSVAQDNQWSGLTSDNVELCRVQLKRYRRSLGIPIDLVELLSTDLSLKKQVLLAALVKV